QESTDVATNNADCSQTDVIIDHTGDTSGAVRDITTTQSGIIVQGAGQETTITRQSFGSVPIYQTETIAPSANGDVTDTTLTRNTQNGPLLLETTVTTNANGLFKRTDVAVNGDTTTDFSTTDAITLNPDGRRIETVTRTNAAGLIS